MAFLSWVAWKEGRFAEAERVAEEALEQWRPTMVRYPFAWICLWPLVAVRLAGTAGGKDPSSPPASCSKPQMRLPVEVEVALGSAVSAWDVGEAAAAVRHLGQALRLAMKFNFA